MDGIGAEEYDRTYRDRDLVRRILSYFRTERRRMAVVSVTILAGSLLGTALPVVMSRAIDQAAAAGTAIGATVAIVVAVALLNTASWALNAVRRILGARAIGSVVLRLRQDAFAALMRHDLSFYDYYLTGKIVSRVASDTQAFSDVVTLTMEVASQFTLVLLILVYLATVDPVLTLITLALVPVITGVALGFRRFARAVVTQARRATAEVSAHVHETVSGITIAKSFRKEQVLYDQFAGVNRRSYRLSWRSELVFSSIFPLLFLIAGLGTATLAYAGGLRATIGELTIGEWYLFLQGVGLLWFPLTSIASFWSQFQLGLAAGERVFALLDAEPQVTQRGAEPVASLAGRIELRDVCFHYTTGESVFDRFSLTVQPGETLALVDHTGSGKSSITKLVARFYEYQSGEILMDGRDVRTFDLAAYRAHLGFVTQVPFLFNGTVLDNIRYGRSDAEDTAVTAAAHRVGGGDWIATLPDGFNTQVAERGRNLSLGQRQLISLARVLLQDQGAHQTLLAAGGHYAELYNTYFRHQSLEYVQAAGAAGEPG